ncbi:MAG TPA: amidohydrolase family protein [Nocardioidaceae bacterium]|nr:amidohydrolase family protein [Nocardioidaceae bacterium]
MALRLRSARLVPTGELRDLVLRDGRCTVVDPSDHAYDVDESVDLDGRWVLPGLWDHHVHFDSWALSRGRLDLSETMSAADVTRVVAERLRSEPPADGATLEGYGFRDALWSDAPHRDLLDAVAPDVPVVLAAWDLHSCWVNSAAAHRYGVADHPTGVLRETEWYPIAERLRAVPTEVLDGWVADAVRAAAARGVVGVVELEMSWQLDTWVRRVADGHDALRVSCGVYPQLFNAAISRGLRTGDPAPGGEGLVTMGPLKVITDGALNTRTAYCVEPYADGADDHGILNVAPDDLVSLISRARQHGITPAIHAIGDWANTLALDAFEAVGARGSIEHAQLLSRADLPRFAALGVTASVQPEHAMDDRDVVDRHWSEWAERAYVFGDLVAAGATLAFGSDAPVAPLDPWLAIAAAVDRSRDGREPWHPEQAIPIETALASSVRGGLPIRDGAPADLAIVDRDPMTASAGELRAMPVAGTLLGGRWTWRSGV